MIAVQFAVDNNIDSFLREIADRNVPGSDRCINDTMFGFAETLNETVLVFYRLSD